MVGESALARQLPPLLSREAENLPRAEVAAMQHLARSKLLGHHSTINPMTDASSTELLSIMNLLVLILCKSLSEQKVIDAYQSGFEGPGASKCVFN
jgi:hypothetical protein